MCRKSGEQIFSIWKHLLLVHEMKKKEFYQKTVCICPPNYLPFRISRLAKLEIASNQFPSVNCGQSLSTKYSSAICVSHRKNPLVLSRRPVTLERRARPCSPTHLRSDVLTMSSTGGTPICEQNVPWLMLSSVTSSPLASTLCTERTISSRPP